MNNSNWAYGGDNISSPPCGGVNKRRGDGPLTSGRTSTSKIKTARGGRARSAIVRRVNDSYAIPPYATTLRVAAIIVVICWLPPAQLLAL